MTEEEELQALREKLAGGPWMDNVHLDQLPITVTDTKMVPYTAYREEVTEHTATPVGRITAIKELREGSRGKIIRSSTSPTLGLAEAKNIMDALHRAGYRLIKIEA